MPTLIDSLVVSLGLDATGFSKGQKDAVDSLRDIEAASGAAAGKIAQAEGKVQKSTKGTSAASKASADSATKSYQRIEGGMRGVDTRAGRLAKTLEFHSKSGHKFWNPLIEGGLAFMGVLAGIRGVEDGMQMITSGAAIGRLANNTGIRTSQLSAIGMAAEQFAGGSQAATQQSLFGFSQMIRQFQMTGQGPGGEAINILGRMGVPLSDVSNLPKLMGDLAEKFHKMAPGQAVTVGQKLGFDMGTINLLEKGRGAYNRDIRAVRREGVVTAKRANEMMKVQSAFIGLEKASDALGRAFVLDLAPALTRMAHILTDLMDGDVKDAFRLMAKTRAEHLKSIESTGIGRVFTGTPKSELAARNQAMAYFQKKGYTANQAAGIVANIQAESSYNPSPKINPSNPHYGIAQWSTARASQILKATGIDVKTASYADQLKAINWELDHSYSATKAKIKASDSAQGSALTFSNDFEKPGDGSNERRMLIAGRIAGYANQAKITPALSSRVTNTLDHLRAQRQNVTNHITTTTHIGHVAIDAKGTGAEGVKRTLIGGKGSTSAIMANSGLS
jgi:hypothetical protein